MSKQGSLRLVGGMVGGGQGADIGKTHRYAMRLDDRYDLHAGSSGETAHRRRGSPRASVFRPTAPIATTGRWRNGNPPARTASTWSP